MNFELKKSLHKIVLKTMSFLNQHFIKYSFSLNFIFTCHHYAAIVRAEQQRGEEEGGSVWNLSNEFFKINFSTLKSINIFI